MEQVWQELMNNFFYNQAHMVTWSDILICVVAAEVCALLILLVYYFTFTGVSVNKNYAFMLAMLAPIAVIAALVIRTNVIVSIAMLSSLSIVRFRNSLKEPKDLAFIFWSITAGISAGIGFVSIALLGTVLICIFAIILHAVLNNGHKVLLTVKIADYSLSELKDTMNKDRKKAKVRFQSQQNGKTEIVYELRLGNMNKTDLFHHINTINGVASVSLVSIG